MHYAGMTSRFIIYPANQVTIEFSNTKDSDQQPLQTRTKEGLQLNLHFSFQYKIQKKNLQKLYAYVGEESHENLYERVARDIILKEAGEYEAPEYWLNRSHIGNQMKARLNASLNSVYADCTAFQFLSIDLPDSYENAIVLTQIENQKKSTFTYKRETSIIESEI